MNYIRKKRDLAAAVVCLLLAVLILTVGARRQEEVLASHIAPDILRFHILANSDSAEDQELKLLIRGQLLSYLEDQLDEDYSKESITLYVNQNREQLQALMNSWIAERGISQTTQIETTSCYFPAKTYGDVEFPCGTYDAVRVTIGAGKGHNWWCVLYPPLCFVDAAYAVVPDSSLDILEDSLDAADFRALLRLAGSSEELAASEKPAASEGEASAAKGLSDGEAEKRPQVQVEFRLKLLDFLRQ